MDALRIIAIIAGALMVIGIGVLLIRKPPHDNDDAPTSDDR